MSNSQNRFSFVRLLTFGGIAFLLLGLFLASSAQADTIYAARINSLNGASFNNYYNNARFSNGDTSQQYCSQQSNGSSAYIFTQTVDGVVYDYTPMVLCDLGAVLTVNSLDVTAYSVGGNSVKGMKVELYDTPALSGTPVHTQEFTVAKTGATTLTLSEPVQARYAKITMTSNYNGDRVGVADVMFNVESYLKNPTSASVNVTTLSGRSLGNLYDTKMSTEWVTNAADTTNGYYNGSNANPVLTFNYDTPVTLSSVYILTYSANGNSLKDFQLDIFDNAGNQYTHNFAMTDCNYGVQNGFSFPEVENVTSVKMTVTSNFWGIAPGGGDRLGIGGVFFSNLEVDLPTTPELYNGSLCDDNVLIRPTNGAFVTLASETASDAPLSNLFDGTGTNSGENWHTKTSGSNYFDNGISPTIDLTLPKGTYDSFSVWGNDTASNQMTDFILELFNDGQVVFADEFRIDQNTDASHYATFSLDGKYISDSARLTVLDNAFARYEKDGAGGQVGFAEIAFYQNKYYLPNSIDISLDSWTIDGTPKIGVRFTEGDEQTATFAKPIILNADGVIEVAEGKKLLLTGGISGQHELKKTGDGLLQINSAAGAVDVQSLVVSSGRLDMKTYFKGSLIIGEELEEGSYTKATFSPGNSIGTLTIDGSFTLNPGSILLMEVGTDEEGNPAADQLIVTGNATFEPGSFIYLDLDENSSLVGGDTLNVILQANNSANFGDDFIDNFVRSYYFTDLQYTQLGDGTYAITATLDPNAVPEPSTWALMALGVVGLMYWRKRK